MSTPAGWYPTQVKENHERYWDGEKWTNQLRPIEQIIETTQSEEEITEAVTIHEEIEDSSTHSNQVEEEEQQESPSNSENNYEFDYGYEEEEIDDHGNVASEEEGAPEEITAESIAAFEAQQKAEFEKAVEEEATQEQYAATDSGSEPIEDSAFEPLSNEDGAHDVTDTPETNDEETEKILEKTVENEAARSNNGIKALNIISLVLLLFAPLVSVILGIISFVKSKKRFLSTVIPIVSITIGSIVAFLQVAVIAFFLISSYSAMSKGADIASCIESMNVGSSSSSSCTTETQNLDATSFINDESYDERFGGGEPSDESYESYNGQVVKPINP